MADDADAVLPVRGDLDPILAEVLQSAARLQQLVPDAVLVGGSAAALWAGHRLSLDHDHVVTRLRENVEVILDALENDEGWATNRTTPGEIIPGQLGGIESGLRQLVRRRPLEEVQVARQLFDPSPKDSRTVQRLSQYKGLSVRWQHRSSTVETCRAVATRMVLGQP